MAKRTNLQIWTGFCSLLEFVTAELKDCRARWIGATSNEWIGVRYDRMWRKREQVLSGMERFVDRRTRKLK